MRSDVPQERGAASPETPISAVSILFNGNPLAIWIYDAATLKFLDANQSALTQYGYSREEFLQLALSDIVISGSEAEEGERHPLPGQPDHAADVVQRHRRSDGTQLNVAVRSNEVHHLGRVCKLVIAEDITERWHLNAELVQMAHHDALTGLPNRSLLRDRMQQRAGAAHSEQKMFALILLDLERFRIINETLGQHAGDELLRRVARRLQDGLDENDILARPGGNVFAMVTRRTDGGVALVQLLEQTLLQLQGQPFEFEGKELLVVAKAGIAVYPGDGEDADILYRNAEAALAKAKLSADRYLFYAPEFNARVAETLALENKLRRAVERGEMVLHYQPKVDLKKRRISGLEALMRWNDPDTGLVPPFKFISILEETGLILEAGRWALEQAIADFSRWKGNGLRVPRIAVNVSAIQLRQKDFVATVERALGAAGEGVLELEITESLIMQDVDANIRTLRAIRDMGVEIAVDDFGTGYSSLSYISRLPINTLKIDRAFIMNMTSKPDDLSIVSTIISLGHSLELKIVAEGVETEEQANLLRLLKCDEFQGYLFSRPVPAQQVEALLRENHTPSRPPN